MAMSINPVSDKRKNACAVNLMRSMLVKYAQKHGIPFEDAMLQFTESDTYETLFEYDTPVLKEVPEYLLDFNEE